MKWRAVLGWTAGIGLVLAAASGVVPGIPTVGDFRRDIQTGFGRGIHLAGRIVDENGAPVDGVSIGVTRHEGRFHDKFTVNRQFDLHYTNDLCIYVGFNKEGYYEGGGSYMVDEDVPVGPDGRRRIEQTNMVVVLRSIGGDVIVAKESRCLTFRTHGVDVGLRLRKGENSRATLDSATVANVFSDTLPTNSFFIKPRLVPDGLIAVTNWFVYSDSRRAIRRAVDPVVEMTGMSNGFVRYTPLNLWPTIDNGVWREMRDCPETGYTNRLVFGFFEKDEIYAFFRIGGFYGKGRFIVNPVPADRRELRILFDGAIQPDGTRNVRTGSNWR